MKCEECRYNLEDYGDHFFCIKCNLKYPKVPVKVLSGNEYRRDIVPVGNDITKQELKTMAESKAIPMNLIVSDKGKKSVRVGKAFVKLEGTVPLSIILSREALNKAISSGTVSETKSEANEKYPDEVLDGKMVVRIAGFPPKKK